MIEFYSEKQMNRDRKRLMEASVRGNSGHEEAIQAFKLAPPKDQEQILSVAAQLRARTAKGLGLLSSIELVYKLSRYMNGRNGNEQK